VALQPSGHLLLSLTRDTYQSFGITGRPCAPGQKAPGKRQGASAASRFLVSIDLLRDPGYQPGGKKFARLQWCLEHTLTRPFDFLLSVLAPPAGRGSASRPEGMQAPGLHALLLDLPPDLPPCVQKLQRHPASCTLHTRMCRAPMLHDMLGDELPTGPAPPGGQEPVSLARAWSDVLEWVGMLGVEGARLRVNDDVDPFVSGYTVPGSTGPVPRSITTLRLDGFLPGPLAHAWIAHVL
jgi:ribonuclease P/MRP protein subunit RPP40